MVDGDQRKFARQPLMAEIQYKSNSPALKARISDISLGGMFIDTVNALDLGSPVTFRFFLPHDRSKKPVIGEGVVKWRQKTVGMGIRFTRMSKEDWNRIKAFIDRASA